MRIIAGSLRGRKIIAPKTLPVRPTTDMVKESLFNILNNQYHFDDISVLDLFSGTGNISFEFASRGTTHITSIDEHLGCIQFINKTAEQFNISIRTMKFDAFKFLEKASTPFDIIFADPPYEFPIEANEKLMSLVFDKGLLNPNGVLVIEHSKHIKLNTLAHYTYEKNYGSSTLSFFNAQ